MVRKTIRTLGNDGGKLKEKRTEPGFSGEIVGKRAAHGLARISLSVITHSFDSVIHFRVIRFLLNILGV